MTLFKQYRGLKREIYILFFGRIVTNLGSMVWPVMTLILSRKLGYSAAEISYFIIISGALMLPASLVGGKLADRFNKKWIIVICDSVSILCYFVSAAIPLGIATIILFVLAGIFQNVEYPAYDALFADLSTTKDRERAFSLEYLGGNIGLVLSPTIAGLLFKDHLWLSFLISGISIGLSTMLIAALVKDVTPVEDDGEESEYQEKKEGVGVFRVLKENPLLLLYVLGAALYYAAYGQYNYIIPLDMASVHGDSGAVIFGTVSSLNCIAVVIFTPIITRVFKKLRDTGKILTGRILVFTGYLTFLLLLGFIPGYYIAMLVFTWGEIFSTVAEGPYVSTRIPASHRGRINGFMNVAGALFIGAVDFSVGQLYDRAGSTWTWVLILSVTVTSALLAVLQKIFDKKAYPKLYKNNGKAADR
ncbi:MAG: MFS transporter [Clostridia bacterium]|nr:MFS transporter [Clostridia bacterium]